MGLVFQRRKACIITTIDLGALVIPAAPSGAQYPHLLDVNSPATQTFGSTYTARPAFSVPGVDFAVGINRSLYPTNASLKDPNTLSIAGCTVNRSVANGGSTPNTVGNFIEVTGNNVFISGFDFSLHGGWQIEIGGSGSVSNATIDNCFFKQFATAQIPILFNVGAIGGTVQNCEIDGNNGTTAIAQSSGTIVIIGNGGNFLVQSTYIHDPYSDAIDPGGSTATTGFSCLDCLLVNMGAGTDGLAHPDFIQAQSAAGVTPFSSFIVRHNTLIQPNAPVEGGTQGITIYQHSPNFPSFVNPDCSFNVFIAPFPGIMPSANEDVNPFIAMSASTIIGTGTITNNWVDTAGNISTGNAVGNFVTDNGGGPQSGTVTVDNTNISLTGKTLTSLGSGNWRFV
jgi:hypothetical protein